MSKKAYLSDKLFTSQKSLYDEPTSFQTNLTSGCVFYLGIDAKNSGDFLIISQGSFLTISLVGDVESHGILGKSRLDKIRPYIENIVETASRLNKRLIADSIMSLDKHLEEYLVALSFVKIMDSHRIQYLNIGENKLFFIHGGTLEDKSAVPGKKVGLFKLISDSPSEIREELTPHEEELSKNDRIFICTDGVQEYLHKDVPKSTVPYIAKKLSAHLSLENTVRSINENMARKLRLIKSGLQDDYTIVLLELT